MMKRRTNNQLLYRIKNFLLTALSPIGLAQDPPEKSHGSERIRSIRVHLSLFVIYLLQTVALANCTQGVYAICQPSKTSSSRNLDPKLKQDFTKFLTQNGSQIAKFKSLRDPLTFPSLLQFNHVTSNSTLSISLRACTFPWIQ